MEYNQITEFNAGHALTKFFIYVQIFLPILMTILAIYLWQDVTGIDIFVFFLMYFLTAIGITIGYHRYFTHRAFKCKPWFQVLLAILGGMAGQGTLLDWVATHRHHHQQTDQIGDPHSPNTNLTSPTMSKFRAFWHAHLGWILQNVPQSYNQYAFDWLNNPLTFKLSRWYLLWQALGLLLPGIITGLWTQSVNGLFMGILWGGFVRMCVVQHLTYSINSFCHMMGKRTYNTPDLSRNNWVFGLFSFGEGWHNNHHAFPTSVRQGFTWWQIDISYYIIIFLSKLGIVWDIKLPKALTENAK